MSARLIGAAVVLLAACTAGRLPYRPEGPVRLVSVVPNVTEMLFAIGAGPQVIAVGDFDSYPEEVQELPRLGGLLNPNIERIIQLRPDLVITYHTQDNLQTRLAELGIRVLPYSHGNTSDTLDYIESLGRTVGRSDQAGLVVGRIRRTLEEIRGRPRIEPPPKVLLIHGRGPGLMGSFYSVGSRAFQSELIETAGGENLFADVDSEVIQPSFEEILNRQPDVIIETLSPDRNEEIRRYREDWNAFAKIPAVAAGRVHVIAEDYMLSPGPRLDKAAERYAEFIRKRQ